MMVKNCRRVLSSSLLLLLIAPAAWAGKGILVGTGGAEPLLRVVRTGERVLSIGYGVVISRTARELIFLRNREVISLQNRGETFVLQRDVASEAQYTPFLTALNLSGAGSRNETCGNVFFNTPSQEIRITWYGPRRSTDRVLLYDSALPPCSSETFQILTAAEAAANNVLRDGTPPVSSAFLARANPAVREISGEVFCGARTRPSPSARVGLYAAPPLRCEFEVCFFNNVSPLLEVPIGPDGRFTIPLPQNAPASPLYVLVAATAENLQACGGQGRSYLTFPVPGEPAGNFEVRLNGAF